MDDRVLFEALCRLDASYYNVLDCLNVLRRPYATLKGELIIIFLYKTPQRKGRNIDVFWWDEHNYVGTHYRYYHEAQEWLYSSLPGDQIPELHLAINIQGLLH